MPTASAVPRMFQLAAPAPQVQISWANYDNTPTVYITSDPSLNVITVTVQNGLPGSLAFAAGAPAEYGQPLAGSAIYVAFSGLLSAEEIASIVVTAPGWTPATYDQPPSLGQYLCIAPDDDLTLASGDAFQFTLSGFTCADPIASGYVQFMLTQVSGYSGPDPVQVNIQVANPPQPQNQILNLLVGFANTDTVVTGATANELVLTLSNPGTKPLVQGAWTATPTLQLNFVYDPAAASALTTAENGAQIVVDVGETNGGDWRPVAAYPDAPSPYWVMQPAADNPAVLGPGSAPSATVSFDISGIVTALPPGITLATLSYWNFPGYNDGQFVLPVVKVDPVVITSFESTIATLPATVPDPTQPATGTLSFTVENAGFVLITNTPYAKQATGSPFSDSCDVSVDTSTTFTLIATNFNTAQQASQSLQVQLTPDPYHAIPTGAIVMWAGSVDSIPTGWALCDGRTVGTFVTPDLVNQFILGADPNAPGDGAGEAVGSSGPPDSHTHQFTVDTPVTTDGDGGHWHGMTLAGQSLTYTTGDESVNVVTGVFSQAGQTTPTYQGYANTLESTTQGLHTHTFTVTQAATDTTEQSSSTMRPAWYALFYIMKCY